MTKTMAVSGVAVGASLLVTYAVAGGRVFWFAAIAAGLVALTWSAQRRALGGISRPGTPGRVELSAYQRALPWVFCGVTIAMVGMVLDTGVGQVNPMHLLFLVVMGLGLFSSLFHRGGQGSSRG